jgi:AraC-like DNA-binding protein
VQWLTARRMERARELLVHSGERVSRIAHAVGFADEAYFTRRFRQRFGTSPTACRRSGPGGRVRRARAGRRPGRYSTALTMSSTTFLASPKTIMVLSM